MKQFYLFVTLLLCCGISNGQVKIGNSSYSTLGAALTAINNNQHSGHIVVEITGNTTETQHAILTADNDFSYQSVKIKPGANLISATINITSGSIRIDSREVTIDGENKITIQSSDTSTSVVAFSGKIDNCGIRNCKIFGGGGGAVVSLGVGTSTGVSNCFVENCEIGPYLTNVPKWGIFASGNSSSTNPALMGGLSIKNNIIHDFANTTQCIGILVQSASGFVIDNNRIYQSTQRTTAKWNGIVAQSLFNNNNRITNNTIGYANASGTGTLALTDASFTGISVGANGLYPNSSPVVAIEHNTIGNISIDGNVGNFYGIYSDRMEATHAFNTIGGSSPTAINLVSGSGNAFEVCGIVQVGKGQMTVTDNAVAGVYAGGASNIKFYGISISNSGAGSATDGMLCERNTIGDAVGNNGITINADGPLTTAVGLYNLGRKGHMRTNTISKLTSKSSGTGIDSGYGTYGLIYDAPENVGEFKIEMNNVSNIGNLHQTAASVVCGILHSWRTPNTIAFNTVLGLKSSTSNSAATVYGIAAHSAQKGIKIYNNAVGITLNNGSNAQLVGISCNTSGESNNSTQIGNNSVYLGGAKSSGTSRSVCLLFQNQSLQATRIFDNILENQRSNYFAATGDILSISCTTGTGFNMVPTFNNNVFFGLGAGYILGYASSGGYKYTPAQWAASGQFSTSGYFANPRFENPTAGTPDLHISANIPTVVEGRGNGGQGFDFDIQPRGDYSPNDIGADAGNFVALNAPVITSVGGTAFCTGQVLTLFGNLTDINEVKIGNIVITPQYYSRSAGPFQPMYVETGNVNASGFVTVTNSAGSFTFNTVVTISAVPVISAHPQPIQVCQGQLSTLSVTASNAVSYQWRRNGMPLTNSGNYSGVDTAQLVIANTSNDVWGQFDVVVTGTLANCQAVSNPAAVTVSIPDIALVASGPTTFCTGGSVTLTPMLHTPALQFDGIDDYVDIRGSNYSSMTMSFWMKTTQLGATGTQWFEGTGVIDGRPDSGNLNGRWGTAMIGDKLAFGSGHNGITNVTVLSNTSVNTGQWVHVAVTRTYGTGAMNIYINGQLDASGNNVYAEYPMTVDALRMGGNLSGSHYFNGALDDVKTYPRTLSSAEILLLSQGGTVSNLLDFHLPSDENSGTELRNSFNESYTAMNGVQWIDRLAPAVFQNPTWSNGATTQTITASQTGTYTFSGTGGLCQTFASASIPIQVNQVQLSLNNYNSNVFYYCGSAPVAIEASGATQYTWSPAVGLDTTNGSVVHASPAEDTIYTLTGTDAAGCQSTRQIWILVAPAQPLAIEASTTYIYAGQTVTLTATGSEGLLTWSPAVALSQNAGHLVTVAPTQTTTYTVSGMFCEVPQSITIFVVPEPSVTDNALHFDGVDDYVQMPTQTDAISGTFIVACWVKPTHPTKTMHVFSTRNGANGNTFDIQIKDGNLIHGDIGNGTDWLTTSADAPFAYQANQWMHIAYKITPGQFKIFVNGNLIQTGNYPGTAVLYNNSSNFITLGKNNGENTFLQGTIDDLMISTFNFPDEMMANAPRFGLPAQIRYTFDAGIAGGYNPTMTLLSNQDVQSGMHGTLHNFTLDGPTSNWVIGQSVQPQTISMAPQTSIVYGATYDPGATSSSGLPVTYFTSDPSIASVAGNILLIHNVGTVTIFAHQDGNGFYEYAEPKVQQLTITPKALSLANATAQNKTYDRNASATIAGTLSGIVGTDAVSLIGTGAFASSNAANAIPVTSNSVLTGIDAPKYTLTQPVGLSANIIPKSLTVSGAVAANKVYNGNTTAAINGATLNGVISPDGVTVASNTGTFASPNVGNNIPVTAQLTLGGAAAANYAITQPTGLSANITPLMLAATISGTTTICNGQQANLQVAINNAGQFSVVYTDGTLIYTVNNYSSGSSIPITSVANATYTLVSVTGNNVAVSVSGSATITVLPQNTYYADADGDGYGNAAVTQSACNQPAGFVSNNTDCNDNDNTMHQTFAFFTDADGDGFGVGATIPVCAVNATTAPAGYAANNTDCDDNNNLVYQSATLFVDADNDGYTNGASIVCYGSTIPFGYNATSLGTDCNDNDPSVWRNEVLYIDADNDGYDAGFQSVCYGASVPFGFMTTSLGPDCNDNNSNAWRMMTLFLDADGDNYNVGQQTICVGLNRPPGFNATTLGFDCNDNDASVWRNEVLHIDADNDGYTTGLQGVCFGATVPAGYSVVSNGFDCNDNDATLNQSFPFFADADGDTYGNGSLVFVCAANAFTPPAGYATNDSDCNDADNLVYQNATLYVDADNDGYTSGVTQIVCYGATIPSGFIVLPTMIDCNDTIAAIHPNATEIPNNGIDESCNGLTDENGQLVTSLLNTVCNTTLASIGSLVGITTLPGNQMITGYRIRATNGAQVQTIDRTVPNFTMQMFASFAYATTYTIDIELQRNGVWMGYYGPACQISTPAILAQNGAAQVSASQCGIVLPKINTLIATTSIQGVTGYRFRVTNLTDITGPNQVQTVTRSLNWFTLQMLTRYNYGTTYQIEVAVKTTGDFGGYGTPCEVSSPPAPALVNCAQVVSTPSTIISCTSLAGVSQYRFQVIRDSDGASTTIDRSSNYFTFSNVPSAIFTAGAFYNVRVAVMSAGTWSPFGDACQITAPGAAGKPATIDAVGAMVDFKAVASPNPFASDFGIEITTTSHDNVSVKVYDMLGRLVESTEVKVSDLNTTKVGAQYPAGVYNVIVSQSGIVKILRVIKR